MTILSILEELAATSSTIEKVNILKREVKNSTLKAVFRAAYNPMVSYYIKQIPETKSSFKPKSFSLDQALESLSALSSRSVTGNDAVKFLGDLLSQVKFEDRIVLERVIDRDLRCGCSDSLASRVWPGIVPTFDVMLAHKDISGIKYPCYGQIKSDGARCHMSLQGGKVVAFSRNGKPIELRGKFDYVITGYITEGETLDGELVAIDKSGNILPRKVGNGIVNKAVKGTISSEEAASLSFMVWDIVDYTSTIPYKDRIDRLLASKLEEGANSRIFVLPTVIIKSEAEAQKFFEQCIAAGEEGAMLKNINSVWVPKRSKDLGKMKAEETADLVVVDVVEGTGKYEGMMGALVCETSDGKLRVNVGSGFSDEQRQEFATHKMVGSIVEVMYNQKITSKGKSTASLFLPRFKFLRVDKSHANTLEELK